MTRKLTFARSAIVVALAVLTIGADGCAPAKDDYDAIAPDNEVHPDHTDPVYGTASAEFRSIDGTGNHGIHFELGAAGTPLRRVLPNAYGDGISTMAGEDRTPPRIVSNLVCAEEGRTVNPLGVSDFVWQWGQFLDHDIDLTEPHAPFAPHHVRPQTGDPFFDPDETGLSQIEFFRSRAHPGTGIDSQYPRQQMNMISHYIDASNVYGSDEERALALRTNDGTGRLKTSAGNLLPFNTEGFENAGGADRTDLFFAGDMRANEQVGLTAMHTLFVREHNRLAAEIAGSEPGLAGEEIYQRARRWVGMLMQGITYNEFLPALLGPDPLDPYLGYDMAVSPSIMNCFSTAAYRLGHSMVSPTIRRLDGNGQTIPFGDLPLKDAYFRPDRLITEGGIDPLLRGLAAQPMSQVDVKVVDALRNFLFGDPTAGGLDLASLNIQRGRDHGLPDYVWARLSRGIGFIRSFAEIPTDPQVRALLEAAYGDVNDIDMWVGGLAEQPVNGGHVGELFFHLIKMQFEALRDGDRYWYQRYPPAEVLEIESTTLADVIRRNTNIGGELSDDVFRVN